MSHTTTIGDVAINDLNALQAAVRAMQEKGVNCELIQNAKPRMYYPDQHGNCEYVLRLHDSQYDVGFQKQADGSYSPVFDEWAGHVGNQIGATGAVCNLAENRAKANIGQLMQQYAMAAATNAAQSQGYHVENSYIDTEGNAKLVIAGM